MRKRYFQWIISCIMCMGMMSCNKWLEVNPKLDIYEETLFESAQGYYAALNGLYVNLSKRELYGQELSWGAVEAWGGGYALQSSNDQGYQDLLKYDYQTTSSKAIASKIWLACYNNIAEANNLIENLKKDNTTEFPYGDVVKNMILGEAYAIRSMMHFEIVRIFAKAPVIDKGGITAYVPFVDKYGSKVNAPIPTKEVLGRIISDLEIAKKLVTPFDSIPENPGYIFNNLVGLRVKLDNGSKVSGEADDEFFRYRANRMSLYPITQLLARVCLYAGDNDKAFTYADEIITMIKKKKPYDFVRSSYIGDPMSLNLVEPKLQTEILFSTYNSSLKKWVESFFSSTSSSRLRVADKAIIFANNLNDCRLKAIPQDVSTKYSSKARTESQVVAIQSLVPVLRFPECYYIAAESIMKKDKDKAVEIFNSVVTARGNTILKVSPGISESELLKAIVKEYRREFLSEGAMIFLYKRLNISLKNDVIHENSNDLVIPVPDSEVGIQ